MARSHKGRLHLLQPQHLYRVLKRVGALLHLPRKPKPVWTRYAKALPGERGHMHLMYLPQLLHSFPFSLRCIQTNNGCEFGRTLTLLLRLGIRHTPIWPCSPHLNGKVERVQRTLQEEYWDGLGSAPLEDWERGLQDYVRFYNRRPLHSALGCQVPMSYALQRVAILLYSARPANEICR